MNSGFLLWGDSEPFDIRCVCFAADRPTPLGRTHLLIHIMNIPVKRVIHDVYQSISVAHDTFALKALS